EARGRGSLERRMPAVRRARRAPLLIATSVDGLSLALGMTILQDRTSGVEQLRRRRVRICLGPADDRVPDLVRENLIEPGARLLCRHDHDPRALQTPDLPVELPGDAPQWCALELLDVP